MPNRDWRQHAVDEVRCELGHPTPVARGAERAALAREGDEQVGRTVGAVDAAEAVREIAAREEAVQLLLDVERQAPAAVLVLDACKERLQVFADEGVERRSRRVAARSLGPGRSPRRTALHAGLDGPGVKRLRPFPFSPPSTTDAPNPRDVEAVGDVVATPVLGGLYCRPLFRRTLIGSGTCCSATRSSGWSRGDGSGTSESGCSHCAYATMSVATSPWTSVSRKSRPAYG